MTCANCLYWDSQDQQTGECRLNAPRVYVDSSGTPQPAFPVCTAGKWCGEWVNANTGPFDGSIPPS